MKYNFKDEIVVIELQLSAFELDTFVSAFEDMKDDGNPYVIERIQPLYDMLKDIKNRRL